ncbi:MAG TPA: exosortase/archaeosortase family protein, partial [Polyangiaceae bacterium]|nr:exosortase/archaeosortase family protein [Polyangiaceae bacterium]
MTDVAYPRRETAFAAVDRIGDAAETLRAPRYAVYRRTTLAVLLVVVAFHYSLSTLLRTLKEQTPLAYLGLVPIMSLLLAAACIRPDVDEPPIHDRQVDYIIGMPLLLAALCFTVLMPIRMSTLFWLYRMDLVALPLYVAGTITLLFGVRTLWRLRIPVAFLILAWPLPYTTFLVNLLSGFTGSTLSGLNFFIRFDHVAVASPLQGQGIYVVSHAGRTFPVSVASACSGVNGVVGYLLIAVAFLTVVRGTWLRKFTWLAVGLGSVWLSNVARIFVLLFAGQHWGQSFAIDVLHPFIGLVIFNLVVVGMVLAMRPFGLTMGFARRSPTASLHVSQAVPKVRLAFAIVAGISILGFVANSALRSYDLVLSSLGAPRLVSFSDSPSRPQGWSVVKSDVYTWATPFFGTDS